MQQGYFKYLTASEEDKEWNLYLNVAGYANIEKNLVYPPKGHPSHYNFNFKKGRILNEFQINYITEGYGVFENKNNTYRITPGTIIVIYPGQWHRYRPLENTGWKEHYIGFNGELSDKILKSQFFKPEMPIIRIGFKSELHDLFYKIINELKNEKAGFQQICTGLTIAYIGQIISIIKNKEFEGKDIEKKIQQACFIIRENISENIDIKALSAKLNLGYSYFRKMFKKYTGISPLQYHIQLRLKLAENLLLQNTLSIKEIANQLGFESIFYFSRLFKEKTGLNPSQMCKRKLS